MQPGHLGALAALACLGGCNLVFGLDEVTAADAVFDHHAVPLGSRPVDVALGDLDSDLALDAVVVSGDHVVTVVRNQTAGGVFAPDTVTVAYVASQFVTVDVVAQPMSAGPDLVLIDPAGTAYRIANAAGQLGTTTMIWTIFGAQPGSHLLVAPFEPPSVQGTTVLEVAPDTMAIASHRLVGDLDAPLAGVTLAQPFVAWIAADLDGVVPIDVVIATHGGVGVHRAQYIGGPSGPFDGTPTARFETLEQPIAAGRIDRDEQGDVVARVRDERAVMALYGDGVGGFPRQLEIELDFVPTALAVIELDGVRGLCALGASGADTIVQIVRIEGSTDYQLDPPVIVDGQLVELTTGDFDGDDQIDLALLLAHSATAGELRFLLQR